MENKKRLAIVVTHPVQYYAPLFKLLHERNSVDLKVFYTRSPAAEDHYDSGFNQVIEWDLPLLNGYPYEWVPNTSKAPSANYRKGIVNPSLLTRVLAYAPDAVLIFGWSYVSHLQAMRYFKGKIPVYFRGDSTLLDNKKGLRNTLKTFYLKWVYKHVDHAFYVGTNNEAYFKNYGLKDAQLSFAPHAIDNERFTMNRNAEVAALKQRLSIKEHEIIVLFAGKFELKKSPLILLEAFIRLNKPHVHLLFAGNGKLQYTLGLSAAKSKNIHFLGFQNQTMMPVIYQTCDLLCLPSGGPGETWGLVVNEAMACGKAILVSDRVGCAADLVKNDHNGIVFSSGELNDLTAALEKLIYSKSVLRVYGERSLAMINHWNFTALTQAIENKITDEKV